MKTNPILRAALLAASICVVGIAAARSAIMRELPRRSIPGLFKPLSVDELHHAIVAGGATDDWRPAADQPGVVTLARNSGAGGHLAVVDVLYDAQGWQIVYRSSDALDYKHTDEGPQINPKYNKWIVALETDIRHAIADTLAAQH